MGREIGQSDGYDFYELFHHHKGWLITLEPPDCADFEVVTKQTAFLLNVIDEFSPIFRPLTAELTVCCVDPESRFPDVRMGVEQPVWFMHTDWLPKHLVRSQYANPVSEEISTITIDILLEWIQRACNQQCVDCQEYPVDWEVLSIDTTCAQVFDLERFANRNSLRMECAETRNMIDVPIQRNGDQVWVWGADEAMQRNLTAAPFTVRIRHDWPAEITIEVHWSLWTKPASLGFQAISKIVQKLIHKNWQVSASHGPFSIETSLPPHLGNSPASGIKGAQNG